MAIYTNILRGGSNNHETTAEDANAIATDFVPEGVVGAVANTAGVSPATGGFAVNAQGTPNMTVAVGTGVAYVSATPAGQAAQTLRVYNDASANVSIAANSTGSTRYDYIYISINATNANNPNLAGDNVATLVVSRSTSVSSDDGTPPTYGYLLARVAVANGASSITNGNITDLRAETIPARDGSVTRTKLATVTRRMPFPAYTNSGTAFSNLVDGGTDTISHNVVLPDDYVSGDITVKWVLRPGAPSGTAVLRSYLYVFRAGVPLITLENGVNVNITFSSVNPRIEQRTMSTTFQPNDVLRFDYQRIGADGADTLAGVVAVDAAWIEYTGKA